MKKDLLKRKFVELRATGYTYEKICSQLKITKPTAVKWAKLFSFEIEQQQKHLIAKIFSEGIIEQEQGILIRMEQFRRKRNLNLNWKISDKIDKKLLKGLDKIFKKKIKAIDLRMNDEYVTRAVFIFDDDLKIEYKQK